MMAGGGGGRDRWHHSWIQVSHRKIIDHRHLYAVVDNDNIVRSHSLFATQLTMYFVIAYIILSLALFVSAANASLLSPDAASKLLRSARQMEETEDEYSFLEDYDLRFVECDKSSNLVLLRLCESNGCVSTESGDECKVNSSEFAVFIGEFVDAVMLANNEGDDSLNVIDWASCGEYETFEEGDPLLNPSTNSNYFVGPTCTDDGKDIRFEFFDDEKCSIVSDIKPNGIPYSDGGMVSDYCTGCVEETQSLFGSFEMCITLYSNSFFRCQTNMEFESFYSIRGCIMLNEMFPTAGIATPAPYPFSTFPPNTIPPNPAPAISPPCTLDCLNDGKCEISPRFNFNNGNQQQLEQHEEDEFEFFGEYCSCLDGFYGNRCELVTPSCDLECQNGGTCWLQKSWNDDVVHYNNNEGEDPSLLTPVCRCSNDYYGEFCELKYDCILQCQNGGVCSFLWQGDQSCRCLDGFYGNRCELATPSCDLECQNGGTCWLQKSWNNEEPDDDGVYYNNNEGQAPSILTPVCECSNGYYGEFCELQHDCSLQCQNGGVCSFHSDRGDDDIYFISVNRTSGARKDHHGRALEDYDNDDGMIDDYYHDDVMIDNDAFCDCSNTAGFTGNLCEERKCGRGHCENGASCVKLQSSTSTKRQAFEFACDCSFGYTIGQYTAGRHCQYTATSTCDESMFPNPNGPLFCVNDGICGADVCLCGDEYFGPRCEYWIEERKDVEWVSTCQLTCQNEGQCTKGVKPVADIFLPFLDRTTKSGLFEYVPSDSFDYCWCPPGYFGDECEHQYDLCGAGEHICFHGSKCTNETSGSSSWECDCSNVLAAGLFCQFEATAICGEPAEGENLGNSNFCTNGGTCSSIENKT